MCKYITHLYKTALNNQNIIYIILIQNIYIYHFLPSMLSYRKKNNYHLRRCLGEFYFARSLPWIRCPVFVARILLDAFAALVPNRTKVCSVTDFQWPFWQRSAHIMPQFGACTISSCIINGFNVDPLPMNAYDVPGHFSPRFSKRRSSWCFDKRHAFTPLKRNVCVSTWMVPPFPMVSPNCPAPCTVQRIGGSISVLALLPPPQPHQPHHHPPTGSQGCMGCGIM